MTDARDCLSEAARKALGKEHKRLAPSDSSGEAPRQALMHLARFCPCPEGDSPSAKRQCDALPRRGAFDSYSSLLRGGIRTTR